MGKKYAPEDFKFSLRFNFDNIEPLKDNNKQAVKQLLEFLKNDFDNLTEKDIQNEIYNIARNNNIEPPLFFKQIYNILINKDKGPKLAGFIKIIGITKFEEIVKQFT